jgi:hypothetical protein
MAKNFGEQPRNEEEKSEQRLEELRNLVAGLEEVDIGEVSTILEKLGDKEVSTLAGLGVVADGIRRAREKAKGEKAEKKDR